MVTDSIKIVFANPFYIFIAAFLTIVLWIVFNFFGQLLFFSPFLVFYLPNDAHLSFILTNILSILIGIASSMNIYLLKNSRLKISRTMFSGTAFGLATTTCMSCSSFGFLTISTFGGFGIIATNFLSNYEIPIRIVSIIILVYALYNIHNKITKSCFIYAKDR